MKNIYIKNIYIEKITDMDRKDAQLCPEKGGLRH